MRPRNRHEETAHEVVYIKRDWGERPQLCCYRGDANSEGGGVLLVGFYWWGYTVLWNMYWVCA